MKVKKGVIMMTELGLTYFDIAAIVFLLIFVFVGMSRGFLNELGKIISWVISLLGSKILVGIVEPKIYEFLDIQNELLLNLNKVIDKVDFTSIETLRNTLERELESVSLVGPLLKGLTENNWDITNIYQKGTATMRTDLVNSMLETIEPIAHDVVGIGCFVGLFFVLLLISSIVVSILIRGLNSIKIVGATDKLLGAGIGLVKGCLFFIVLYSLCFIVLSVMGSEHLSILMDSKFFDMVVGIKDILPAT